MEGSMENSYYHYPAVLSLLWNNLDISNGTYLSRLRKVTLINYAFTKFMKTFKDKFHERGRLVKY